MRMEDWQDYFVGERCFILGNGPGLRDVDWDLMMGEFTFATNRIAALWNHALETDWRPYFYVQTSNQMLSRPEWRDDCIDAIVKSEAQFVYVINKPVIPTKLHAGIWWLEDCRHVGMSNAEVPDNFFSLNPALWISKFGTSLLPMFQLAVWMGFDPIYILGCDLNFTSYPQTRKGHNHFYEGYDGKGYSLSEREADQIMRQMPAAHKLAQRVTSALGVEVFNAGPGFSPVLDEIWPRADLKEILRE